MTTAIDFDHLVTSWLETDGPSDVRPDVVDAALATARTRGRRSYLRVRLAGRSAWPRHQIRALSPALLVALLAVALAGGLLLVGAARWLDRSPLVPPGGGFVPTGTMSIARANAAAVRLADGRVLIVGGWASDAGARPHAGVTSAEIYDPATGEFNPTGSMHEGRVSATATLLEDGRVLIAGGYPFRSMNIGPATGLVSAELFDPDTGTFTPTGPLAEGRGDHAAVRLATGEVLIFGGIGGTRMLSSGSATLVEPRTVERFDPVTGSFSEEPAASLQVRATAAIALADGRILTVTPPGQGAGITIYDVASGSVQPVAGSAIDARTAIQLSDGRVLVAGASRVDGEDAVQLMDPSTETFGRVVTATSAIDRPVGPMSGIERAVELPDGRVLMIGRGPVPSGQPGTLVEIVIFQMFDPGPGTLLPVAPMAVVPKDDSYVATVSSDGTILFAGGAVMSETGQIKAIASAFLFASD